MGDELDIGLVIARSLEVVGDCLIFVHSQIFGIGADKSFIKDAARQQVELLVFQGL